MFRRSSGKNLRKKEMKILIDDLTSEPLRIRRDIPSDAYAGEFVLIEPAGIDIEVVKSGRKVFTGGSVRTRVQLACSRCLAKFAFEVEAEHFLEYRPREDRCGEENIRLKKDELAVAYYSEPVINLYDDIRQTIHLAIPFKPVCSEDCGGLCPSCGKDLNEGDCGCRDLRVNPVFEKLRELKGPRSGEEP